jgi:hypothetical protein
MPNHGENSIQIYRNFIDMGLSEDFFYYYIKK